MNHNKPIFTDEASYSLEDADLEGWGVDVLAYVKQNIIDNEPVWSIYAAEGSVIANAPNRNIAEEIIRHNDMQLVTLH